MWTIPLSVSLFRAQRIGCIVVESHFYLLVLKLFCCFVVVPEVHHVGAVEGANFPTERIRRSPLGAVHKVRSATKITDFCFVFVFNGARTQ